MVARILGKLLHMVGILPTDRVTEVQRTDLVGEFVGHTGPKTRRMVCFTTVFTILLFNWVKYISSQAKWALNYYLVMHYLIHYVDQRSRGGNSFH